MANRAITPSDLIADRVSRARPPVKYLLYGNDGATWSNNLLRRPEGDVSDTIHIKTLPRLERLGVTAGTKPFQMTSNVNRTMTKDDHVIKEPIENGNRDGMTNMGGPGRQ